MGQGARPRRIQGLLEGVCKGGASALPLTLSWITGLAQQSRDPLYRQALYAGQSWGPGGDPDTGLPWAVFSLGWDSWGRPGY